VVSRLRIPRRECTAAVAVFVFGYGHPHKEVLVVKFAIELAQAEADLANLIKQVGSGAEVLITRNGEPVARLISAVGMAPDRVPGSAKGLFTVPDDFDAPIEDFHEYM
jgi:prevent-host-death family protein